MASEMVKPDVLNFIDDMVFERIKDFSFDQIEVNEKYNGKALLELGLDKLSNTVLIAIVSNDQWTYLPKPNHVLKPASKLVVITNHDEKKILDKFV